MRSILQSAGYEQHIQDTIKGSAGLCKTDAVRMVVERGPALIRELDELGVAFTRTPEGHFDLGREGGHHRKRIVHVKDHTGRDVRLSDFRDKTVVLWFYPQADTPG